MYGGTSLYVSSTPAEDAFFKFSFQILPLILISVGFIFLMIVIYPIVEYQLRYVPRTVNRELLKPIKILANAQAEFESESENKEEASSMISQVDTTNPKNWFPKADYSNIEKPKIVNYTLSIPKLGIQQANVEMGTEDLKKSLIHYPGSSLPGELGNVIIFGHSTLPIFYNPKVYETIFSTLPSLKEGDEVIARIDGIEYTYVVYEMLTVKPDELQVLEQKYDKYDMSLITCVPPGTKWKRLVVKARLKEL